MHILGPHPRPTGLGNLSQFYMLCRHWTEPALSTAGESRLDFTRWRHPVTPTP